MVGRVKGIFVSISWQMVRRIVIDCHYGGGNQGQMGALLCGGVEGFNLEVIVAPVGHG
jgi:hypothetical protein